MRNVITPIIPSEQSFCGTKSALDLEAICAFAAVGFFLGEDTYWKDLKVLPPASQCELDENATLVGATPYFDWHYAPRAITFDNAVEEFATLFESIVREQSEGREVILPISGGLDSRTQAAALNNVGARVHGFSYSFEGGHDETSYARKIAKAQEFEFEEWRVPAGYLWDVIDWLAETNGCYAEFTHPRQAAFRGRYAPLGDVFNLGHWGDVLFDEMGVDDSIGFDEQVAVIIKKIVKKGGAELAEALWESWSITGSFRDYLTERIRELLSAIDIPNSANARIRAFKSMYWAPRWTSINLSVFRAERDVELPYYDNRMCEFVCGIPEEFLAGRKIQIEYLKRYAPQLARIDWQDHRPFNLYNYHWNKSPWNLPYRVFDRIKRSASTRSLVQRNWELQFVGGTNEDALRRHLFGNTSFGDFVEPSLVRDLFDRFKKADAVRFSHGVSALLTLSMFAKLASDSAMNAIRPASSVAVAVKS